MNKVIKNHDKEKNRYTQSQQNPKSFGRLVQQEEKQKKITKLILVQTGLATTIEYVIWVLQHRESESHDRDSNKALDGFEHSLYQCIYKKRPRTFTALLNKFFELTEADPDNISYKKLRFSPSALIAARRVPYISTESLLSCVVVDMTG